MKRARSIPHSKRIIQYASQNTGSDEAVSLDTPGAAAETKPGTLFGFHWEIRASLNNSLSETGHLNWMLYVADTNGAEFAVGISLAAPPLQGFYRTRVVVSGDISHVIASGTLVVHRHHDAEGTLLSLKDDLVRGSTKTERKLGPTEKLFLNVHGNASLGINWTTQVTYWKRHG